MKEEGEGELKHLAQPRDESQVLPVSGEEEVDSLWSEVLLDGSTRGNFLASQNKLSDEMLTGNDEDGALEDRGELGSHTRQLQGRETSPHLTNQRESASLTEIVVSNQHSSILYKTTTARP